MSLMMPGSSSKAKNISEKMFWEYYSFKLNSSPDLGDPLCFLSGNTSFPNITILCKFPILYYSLIATAIRYTGC